MFQGGKRSIMADVVMLECNNYVLGHDCKILHNSDDGRKGGFTKFNTFAVTLQFSSVTWREIWPST